MPSLQRCWLLGLSPLWSPTRFPYLLDDASRPLPSLSAILSCRKTLTHTYACWNLLVLLSLSKLHSLQCIAWSMKTYLVHNFHCSHTSFTVNSYTWTFVDVSPNASPGNYNFRRLTKTIRKEHTHIYTMQSDCIKAITLFHIKYLLMFSSSLADNTDEL